jgi:CubicO group peptidase (beta-lactamase class C family)
VPSDYWGPVWTDGGLAATAEDLARFGDGLFEGRLLKPSTLKTMTHLNRSGDGLGLFEMRFGGHRWLGHNGRYGGYETEIWNDPARRVTIAVATDLNLSSLATWQRVVTAYDQNQTAGPACAEGA